MEESNIYINQSQDIHSFISHNRMTQQPLYSRALNHNPLQREPHVIAPQSERLYGETMIQTKQNNLIKQFGNSSYALPKVEPATKNGSKQKPAGNTKVKQEPSKNYEDESELFEDSDSDVKISIKKEDDEKQPNKIIDIQLNLGNDSGHLHKREAMDDDSDDDSLFVCLLGERYRGQKAWA